jgi:hypothetical protein
MHHTTRNANPYNSYHNLPYYEMKYTLAIWMGYHSFLSPTQAGSILQDAIRTYSFPNHTPIHSVNNNNNNSTMTTNSKEEEDDTNRYSHSILSSTQVSIAKSRPFEFHQEFHCASAEDILVLKVLFRPMNENYHTSNSLPPSSLLSLASLTRHVQSYLTTWESTNLIMTTTTTTTNSTGSDTTLLTNPPPRS